MRAALILVAVVVLILAGWGLVRFLGARPVAARATATVSSSSEAPVDLVDVASIALQDCVRPVASAVPDGATATREQITAARTSFQAYDAATNSYAHCVDAAIEHVAAQYASVASPTELKSLRAFGAEAHDTAINQEQSVADQLNVQIRAYKAKHPQ